MPNDIDRPLLNLITLQRLTRINPHKIHLSLCDALALVWRRWRETSLGKEEFLHFTSNPLFILKLLMDFVQVKIVINIYQLTW